MKKILQSLTFLSLALFLAGCGVKYGTINVSPQFFDKPDTVVIGHISGMEKGQFLMLGQQRLLEVLINHSLRSSMVDALEKVESQPHIDRFYYKECEKSFQDKEFSVLKIENIVDVETLKAASPADPQHAPYDFTFLRDKYKARYALILQPGSFGVQQTFYSVVPLDSPTGYAVFSTYLVDLKDNSLISYYSNRILKPTNSNAVGASNHFIHQQAAEDALIQALKDAHLHIFGKPYDKGHLYVNER